MDGEEEFEDVEKRLQQENSTSQSIEYAKSRTPRGSKHRVYDVDPDHSGGEEDRYAPPPPPRSAGRHADGHGHRDRKMSSEEFHYNVGGNAGGGGGGGGGAPEQMSDTMQQIEALNRQLAELMRSGESESWSAPGHPVTPRATSSGPGRRAGPSF